MTKHGLAGGVPQNQFAIGAGGSSEIDARVEDDTDDPLPGRVEVESPC